jgi:cation diffusion facilitator CzcD-associated flavoprotein CzcO
MSEPQAMVSDAGLAAAFSLLRLGIRNLRLLDRSEAGREGPWITYARMETLRSPKQLTGPATDLPPLTFRAWYEAQFGREAWERLGKIPRPMWMEYLRWYRDVLDLPVENGIEVTRIEPAEDGLLRLPLRGAAEREILARKVVMATGREGMGEPYIPDFVNGLPRERWAHSADPIDFAALHGRRVVVIGVGASAVDNAAEALEAGAAWVRLLIRRKQMPRVNKLMGIGTPGFTHGFPALSDLWRWRFIHYAHGEQTPPPRDSTLRVSRHPNGYFHFGCGIRAMTAVGDAVRIETASGKRFETDFVILCTGFTVDHRARPELAGVAEKIAIWADRFTPPADLASEELAHFPLSGAGFLVHRTRARHGAVAEGHPLLQPRRDLEPRQDQRRHPGGERRRRAADTRHRRRVLRRGYRAPLRGSAGLPEAGTARRRVDRRRGAGRGRRLKLRPATGCGADR